MKVKFTINENGVLEKAELTDEKGAVITHGVRGYSDEDFDSSLLTDAVIPNGVTCIGDGAFSGCDWLAGVVIPDSVTSIGNRAFYDCYSLIEITIPESVTSIGDEAFTDCNQLESVSLPARITSIGVRAFAFCESLSGVIIPDSVTSIGDRAFYGCTSLAAPFSGDKGNITSLKMTGGAGKDGNYSYYLREKDGEVFFDANYRAICADGEVREVTIENAELTHEDMAKMRERCNKWYPAEADNAAKADDDKPGDSRNDSSVVQVEAVWENNARLDTKMVLGVDSTDLLNLLFSFERLTQRLGGCYYSVPEEKAAEGKIVSIEFSYGGNGRSPFTAYRYFLREEGGNVLFDAHCYTGPNSQTKIILEKAVVSREDMDALLEICGGNPAFIELQKDYAAAASSVYIAPPWRKIYNEISEMQTRDGPHHREIFKAIWENGARLVTAPPDGNKLVLFDYLKTLAARLGK